MKSMDTMKIGYQELFETTNIPPGYRLNKKRVYFDQLSHFVGMKGKKYDNQSTRLLIVGRAVNGWGQIDAKTAETFSQIALDTFERNKFNWVVYDNGTLRNDELDNGKYYWLSDSPFWRTTKKIWMNITNNQNFEDSENDRWVDYIAWTNLYKIAPLETGNPTTTMSKNQLEACKKILKAEIERFNPTHILFVTGYEWWFEAFKDIFEVKFNNVKKNIYRGENKNSFFAEASEITHNGIKIVVACRPECRDESQYIDDVTINLR